MKREAKWLLLLLLGCVLLVLILNQRSIHVHIETHSSHYSGPSVIYSPNDIEDNPGSASERPSSSSLESDVNTEPVSARHNINQNRKVLEDLAKRLKNQRRPIIYVAINNAFIPLANSWLCNTMFMGVHDQVLVIATDEFTRDYLAERWPKITVISQPGTSLRGDQEFGRVGFSRLNVKRMNWTLMLLELGADIFMIEMDSVWFVNPIPDLQKLAEGVDIVTVRPNDIVPYACAGFVYIKPTKKSINMWKRLLEKMNTYGGWMDGMDIWDRTYWWAIKESDQAYLTQLVIRDKYGGIQYRAAPYEKYPDGSWYESKSPENPDVIQNNFLKGNRNKIERAKKFKHWFVDERTEKCYSGRVLVLTNRTRESIN